MKTQITYNVPDEKLDEILGMLGYSEDMPITKEEFMNQAVSSVVIPAISDKFINIKQAEAQRAVTNIPKETIEAVTSMISITTV